MSEPSQPPSPPPPPPSPYYASPPRRTRYEERDYEEIYYHFEDYSQDIIMTDPSKFLTPPEPEEHYKWEDLILNEMAQAEWEGIKKSFCFGMGCGLLSFGMLRWRRGRRGDGGGPLWSSGISRYTSTSSSPSPSQSSAGGYAFDPLPPKPVGLQHIHHHGGGSGGDKNPAGFLIDAALSTFLGLGTSLLAIQSDAFYPTVTAPTTSSLDSNSHAAATAAVEPPPPQWISPAIPLVPGRSIVADTLCGPLTEEFRKFPRQLWQSGHHRGIEGGYNNHMALYANPGWKGTKYYGGNANADVVALGESGSSFDDERSERGVYERLVLDSLQGFVINCERRSRHEQRLRKILGVRKGQPVVIPDEGVSADEDFELDDIYLNDNQVDDGDSDDAQFGL